MNTRTLQFSIPVSLIIWALIIWGCLAIGDCAHAAEVATVDASAQAYSTAQGAAEAALLASSDISQEHELAGGIVLSDGAYYFTAPVTSGLDDHFDIRLKFRGRLVAIYHTHPGANNGFADRFSPEDYAVAARLNVPSYIRSLSTRSNYRLNTSGTVALLTAHSLCHNMECSEYHKLVTHAILVKLGAER